MCTELEAVIGDLAWDSLTSTWPKTSGAWCRRRAVVVSNTSARERQRRSGKHAWKPDPRLASRLVCRADLRRALANNTSPRDNETPEETAATTVLMHIPQVRAATAAAAAAATPAKGPGRRATSQDRFKAGVGINGVPSPRPAPPKTVRELETASAGETVYGGRRRAGPAGSLPHAGARGVSDALHLIGLRRARRGGRRLRLGRSTLATTVAAEGEFVRWTVGGGSQGNKKHF
ncbi:unnamed protein product [Lampetra planeri]